MHAALQLQWNKTSNGIKPWRGNNEMKRSLFHSPYHLNSNMYTSNQWLQHFAKEYTAIIFTENKFRD